METIAVGRAEAGATTREKATRARAVIRMGATQAGNSRRVKRTRASWYEGH
jgi:phage gp29-like protein